jgi:hypothetical protein
MSAAERLRILFDGGSWTEYDKGLVSLTRAFNDTKP